MSHMNGKEKVSAQSLRFSQTERHRSVSWLFIALLSGLCSFASAEMVRSDGTVYTSIGRLLARPEVYESHRVLVQGYYVSGFEISGLFASREDALTHNLANAVWIDA